MTGQYPMLANNLSSPQVHLVMHQLNQCYTQLTWQQNNVHRWELYYCTFLYLYHLDDDDDDDNNNNLSCLFSRLKHVLNDLLRQQQQQQTSSSAPGWQTQKQGSSQESSSGPSASPGGFLPFSSTLHPSANNMSNAAISPFPPSTTNILTSLIHLQNLSRMVCSRGNRKLKDLNEAHKTVFGYDVECQKPSQLF